jgi:hypothetical protein
MIQVTIVQASIVDDKIGLVLDTSQDGGQPIRIQQQYATTMTTAEIKEQIDAAVTLLWTALGNPSWAVA